MIDELQEKIDELKEIADQLEGDLYYDEQNYKEKIKELDKEARYWYEKNIQTGIEAEDYAIERMKRCIDTIWNDLSFTNVEAGGYDEEDEHDRGMLEAYRICIDIICKEFGWSYRNGKEVAEWKNNVNG